MSTKAVILVGGDTTGTRFRPLSLNTPKPLFPIGPKPLLQYSIDVLALLPTVSEILIIGFYPEDTFTDFILGIRRQYPDISVKYLWEFHPLGTAGGLYQFRDLVRRGRPKKIFLIHGDVVCGFPLNEMEEFFEEKRAKAVILGTQAHDDVLKNHGVIVSNSNEKVVHYVEKPETKVSGTNIINSGVYLFETNYLFENLEKAKELREIAMSSFYDNNPNADFFYSFNLDTMLASLPETNQFYLYTPPKSSKHFFYQIKVASFALAANAAYLQHLQRTDRHAPGLAQASSTIIPPVFIDKNADVDPSAKLGPNVSIHADVKVGKGVRVVNSIILPGVTLLPHSLVKNAIISAECKIGRWARVEGVDNSEGKEFIEIDGVKTRPVAILAERVTVKDEVRILRSVVLGDKTLTADVVDEVVM